MDIDIKGTTSKEPHIKKATFSATPYSPIFIGSGQEYFKGLDFFYDESHTFLFDHEKIINKFSKTDYQLVNLRRAMVNRSLDIYIESYLTDNNKKLDDIELYAIYGWYGVAKFGKLKAPILNGLGKPIIPGSSLKGSIRTALFANFFKQESLSKQAYWNKTKKLHGDEDNDDKNMHDKELMPYLFSTTKDKDSFSNYNLGRALRIGDIEFSNTDLEVFNTATTNINNQGVLWLVYGKNNDDTSNLEEASNESFLALSHLLEDTPAQFSISIDKRVLEEKNKENNSKHGIGWKEPFNFKTIAMACNQLSLKLVNEELNYFRKAKKNLVGIEKLVDDYKYLKEDIEICIKEVRNNKGVCWIQRVGRGTGWHSMTGAHTYDKNPKDNEYMEVIRERGDFVDHNLKYPKTRKVVLDQRGNPKTSMGWVYVKMQ